MLFETDEYMVYGYNNQGQEVFEKGNLTGSEVIRLVQNLRQDPSIVRVSIDIAFPPDRDKVVITHLVENLIN